jgi:hypothetical protein
MSGPKRASPFCVRPTSTVPPPRKPATNSVFGFAERAARHHYFAVEVQRLFELLECLASSACRVGLASAYCASAFLRGNLSVDFPEGVVSKLLELKLKVSTADPRSNADLGV